MQGSYVVGEAYMGTIVPFPIRYRIAVERVLAYAEEYNGPEEMVRVANAIILITASILAHEFGGEQAIAVLHDLSPPGRATEFDVPETIREAQHIDVCAMVCDLLAEAKRDGGRPGMRATAVEMIRAGMRGMQTHLSEKFSWRLVDRILVVLATKHRCEIVHPEELPRALRAQSAELRQHSETLARKSEELQARSDGLRTQADELLEQANSSRR
jgi:hypothetical protein